MADKRGERHPDLDRLLDLEAGRIEDAAEAGRLSAHLSACPVCRLELVRLRDFLQADADAGALQDAGWDRAELELQRRFAQDTGARIPVAAAVAAAARPQPRDAGRWSSPRWLTFAPLAAAAALAVLFFSFDRIPQPGLGTGGDTLRGGEPRAPRIELVFPIEQIPEPPARFTWRTDARFDSYVLEVFSPDLDSVFRIPDLRATSPVLPDSVVALLKPGYTYLWNVQGRSGLADGELSLTAWFRIGPPLRKPAPHGGGGSKAQ